jgi:hypothetical protein
MVEDDKTKMRGGVQPFLRPQSSSTLDAPKSPSAQSQPLLLLRLSSACLSVALQLERGAVVGDELPLRQSFLRFHPRSQSHLQPASSLGTSRRSFSSSALAQDSSRFCTPAGINQLIQRKGVNPRFTPLRCRCTTADSLDPTRSPAPSPFPSTTMPSASLVRHGATIKYIVVDSSCSPYP